MHFLLRLIINRATDVLSLPDSYSDCNYDCDYRDYDPDDEPLPLLRLRLHCY